MMMTLQTLDEESELFVKKEIMAQDGYMGKKIEISMTENFTTELYISPTFVTGTRREMAPNIGKKCY
ncbi:unnamed protein product [Rhizophagus irregularis]|nr:unnamed protein product [Rhizophagus irregularis]